MILPKEHYRNLYDIDEEVVAKAMILAKKMVNKLTKVLDCDGYNIVQNNEGHFYLLWINTIEVKFGILR